MPRARCLSQLVRSPFSIAIAVAASALTALGARALITNLVLAGQLHAPQATHVAQSDLVGLVRNNQTDQAFEEAFEDGDALFATVFNALDGAGANVGQGQRFTRVPRADLTGAGEWANHTPSRATGPNAQSCNACHNEGGEDGAGGVAGNVHRDPQHSANLKHFIQRSTPHLFGAGAVQRLAEEMTTQLLTIRSGVIAAVCSGRVAKQSAMLTTKGVNFGVVRASAGWRGGTPCPQDPRHTFVLDTTGVRGVDTDLVVKPFQWKGSVAFIRAFNRDAAHNEIGMQAVELVGDGVDADFDGVADELSVGDMTALALYIAGQPRPVTTTELATLGLAPAPSSATLAAIADGAVQFHVAVCDSCHKPSLVLDDPLFSEPSQNPSYRDATFPAGQDPVARGVDPAMPITFDLTQDITENRINHNGQVVGLGNHVSNGHGGATIALFGDLKRHDMGPGLAESIDEVGTGASTFLTENLWGVGSTAPYLHDGRATTLTEAILEHGGEAAASRAAFAALTTAEQKDLLAFLNNLVLFKQETD